jgi:hypothetical protein
VHPEKVVQDHIRGFGRQYNRHEWQVPAVNIEQWRDRETVYPVIIVVPANPIFEQGLGSGWNNHRSCGHEWKSPLSGTPHAADSGRRETVRLLPHQEKNVGLSSNVSERSA